VGLEEGRQHVLGRQGSRVVGGKQKNWVSGSGSKLETKKKEIKASNTGIEKEGSNMEGS